jgi:hypothetical protein
MSVCVVLCIRFMTRVTDAGLSAELWRFDTSTLGWQKVDNTTVNGADPSGSYYTMTSVSSSSYTMASVGLDLWIVGGLTSSGEGDTCTTPRAAAVATLRKGVCLLSLDVSSNCWN